jgi:hypothetical protein
MTKRSQARIERARRKRLQPVAARIALSDAAAVRAFSNISENATRLLVGMLRVIASKGATSGCFSEVVAKTTLTDDEAMRGLDELRMCGLMQRTPHGTDRLHPLFGSIGHRLSDFAQGMSAGGGGSADVVPFGNPVGK